MVLSHYEDLLSFYEGENKIPTINLDLEEFIYLGTFEKFPALSRLSLGVWIISL
jgi:hypothetical protein